MTLCHNCDTPGNPSIEYRDEFRSWHTQKLKSTIAANQKQQSSVESRKARSKPSKNSDSDESQAGKRAPLAQPIPNSAVVPKIDNLSSAFPLKYATSRKKR